MATRIDKFSEFAYSPQGVDTVAKCTEALGGESSDVMQTPLFINTKLYDKVVATVTGFSLVSTHVLTLTLMEATATDGTGSADLSGKSTTHTATAIGDEYRFMVEVDSEELSSGFQYVGAKVETDDADGSESCCITLFPMNPRHSLQTLLSPL